MAGSGELDSKATSGTDNMGQTVTDLSDKLEKTYAGSATTYTKHGVHYTAISVMKVLAHPSLYQPSVDDGVRNLNAYLSKFLNGMCPGNVVLAGYSQGADVVMRSYNALTPALQLRVKAVVLFGDPYFNPYASYDRGSFDIRPDGTGFWGVRIKEGPVFAAKAHSYCLYKDPVCNSSANPVVFAADWQACKDAAAGKPVDCPHFDYRTGWTYSGAVFVNTLLPPVSKAPVLDHILVSPNPATIVAGSSQTYTAGGYDAANNSLGMVTASTTFTIAPDGSCTGSVCTASSPGTHTVTGTSNGVTGTAILNVQPISTGLTGVQNVTTNDGSAYALKSDGTVWSWGSNAYGQLGNGTSADSAVPVQVTGLTGVQSISSGGSSAFAVKSDGSVWSWGFNGSGQLGNGTTTDSPVPVQVTGLTGVHTISSVHDTSGTTSAVTFALKTNGTVWAWGSNQVGQLGTGTTTSSLVPIQVTGLTGVQNVTANYYSVFALKSDGTVWSWGAGLLGNGTSAGSLVPVQVTGLTGVQSVTTNDYDNSVFALESDGTVWAWGPGLLGNGTSAGSLVPVQVTGLTGVQSVTTNNSSAYALKSDGTVLAWGGNSSGQLGNGTTTDSSVPVQVTGLTGVQSVTVIWGSAFAVKTDGTAWAWGYNSFGDLGNGTLTASSVPVQVTGLTGVQNVTASRGDLAFAVKTDGTVWSWGYNGSGQLGSGTTFSAVPIQVR